MINGHHHQPSAKNSPLLASTRMFFTRMLSTNNVKAVSVHNADWASVVSAHHSDSIKTVSTHLVKEIYQII